MRFDSTESVTTESLDSLTHDSGAVQDYMINLLSKMKNKSALPLNGYKELVRFLISEFNDLPYLNQENELIKVKSRYGNPERTIAKMRDHDNLVLPLITISQNSIVEDSSRQKYAPVIIQKAYWNDKKQRAIRVLSYCDRPVNIQYNINIWSKYMEDMDQLAQQIRLKFNPSIQLHTNFTKDSQAFLASETNNYSFSLADREDRIIRKTLTVLVETYIKSPEYMVTSSGKIEELKYEVDLA